MLISPCKRSGEASDLSDHLATSIICRQNPPTTIVTLHHYITASGRCCQAKNIRLKGPKAAFGLVEGGKYGPSEKKRGGQMNRPPRDTFLLLLRYCGYQPLRRRRNSANPPRARRPIVAGSGTTTRGSDKAYMGRLSEYPSAVQTRQTHSVAMSALP